MAEPLPLLSSPRKEEIRVETFPGVDIDNYIQTMYPTLQKPQVKYKRSVIIKRVQPKNESP